MGTRSLTVFQETDGTEIAVMYRHFDGYPTGHGDELARFLAGFKIVAGLGTGDKAPVANGIACLAAQVVAHFKTEPGGFYLHAAGTRDIGEEYVYTVSGKPGEGVTMRCENGDGKKLYEGPAVDFSGVAASAMDEVQP